MNHDRAKRLLPALVDRQTGLFQRFFLSRHVASCPFCLAELEASRAMRAALRTNLPIHRAPPNLAQRIASALQREAPPAAPRQPFRFGLPAAALAGGFAGVALTLALTRALPPPDPIATDAVADHIRSMMAGHLTDVATSDQHTVKPWLSARLDLSPVVKDFATDRYSLIGGRLDYVDGHRAAAIIYQRDMHVINLFAFVADEPSSAAQRSASLNGFNIMRWQMGGLTYVAVSDVEAMQLLRFVQLVKGG